MTQDFLSGPSQQQASPVQAPPHPHAAQTAAPPAPAHNDVLAGAFPEWDILPAVPFVRRIK